jgi:hypothetical protein
MLKKSLIFGSVALFIAALITLTGCPTSTDDDSSTSLKYAHRIYGSNVDPYTAQQAIDNAVAAGEPIVLEHGLTIAGPGHLNFKNADVRINGVVWFNGGGVVSVVDAIVTWADNGHFNLPGGYYIHRSGQNTRPVNIEALVEYAESLETIMPTATKAAVKRFKLGAKQNHDYSVNSNGVNARVNAEALEVLYVLDELIIDSNATNPGLGTSATNLTITAMGIVDITGTPPDSVIVGEPSLLDLGTCSILTTSKGGVVVTVPEAPTLIPNIKVDAGKNFIITQDTTTGPLTISGKLTGAGTLEVLGDVGTGGNIIINGGDGSIRFSGAAAPQRITIASTGTVTFDNAVTSLVDAAGVSTIAGNVVFSGNVTTTGLLELLGNVTLANSAVVTLANGKALTLGAGKTISVRFTPRGGTPIVAPVLSAGPDNVVLTPAGATTLTVPGNPSNEAGIPATKRLILGVAGLTVTDGILQVAPEASLAIAVTGTLALTTGITNNEIGYLAVADGGSLVLGTNGTVVIGNTTIGSASTLKAGGGTITLGNNQIQGSVLGATLTATAGSPAFTLAAQILTLKQADLNLAANGSISIADGARVILTERGKITLNNGEGGVPTTLTKIGPNGDLSGGVGLTNPSDAEKTSQSIWSVVHQDTAAADVSITATGAAVSISRSSKFTAN